MSNISFKQFLILSESDQLETDLNELQLDENIKRAFRRSGKGIRKQFRCQSGAKKGMVVSSPGKCHIAKSLKRVIAGKSAASANKGSRIIKTRTTKRTSGITKRIIRLNKNIKR